ncbi:MAG: AraC family transcriptional regulator [Caldilineaceae bacterium]
MDRTNDSAAKRDTQRIQADRIELAERIAWATHQAEAVEPLSGLHFFRVSAPLGPLYGVTEPSFCVIAQGSKEILQGGYRYRYDPYHYLLATVDLPRISHVLEASPTQPYLSLRLDLSPALVSSVILESAQTTGSRQTDARAIAVSALDVDLLDAVVRLVRLVECPNQTQVLMPLIKHEIVYRLLIGEQGARLRHLTVHGGSTPHIARAVERLRRDFNQPLRIEQIAHDLGMSVSGFHHHFKAVTALSPLQFQKQLRLQEARRLMLGEDLDAASAAFRVGYQDASHFSREYKSLFGAPPLRDVQRLREEARTNFGG